MHYDYIITGGGAAGLNLALAIIQSDLAGRSVLIVDREAKKRNDRTWCFWTNEPTGIEPILYRSWSQIRFSARSFDQVLALGDYRYHMVRGIDFYNYARTMLSARPNVHWIQGAVDSIKEIPNGVQVDIDNQIFTADYAFDSIFKSTDLQIQPQKYHYLKQHFLGWTIETTDPFFDPKTPTLFDFRIPQNGAMRFMYTLPFSPNSALIEYTLFSEDLLLPAEYQQGLREYIERDLGIKSYSINETEQGIIPMTDHVFPRRPSAHVLNIGTKGGRVKPSSGYAFWRIQQDSIAVVRSLLAHNHPFHIPETPARYRWFDTILLQIMKRHADDCANIFKILFEHNSIQNIFRFLNEENSWFSDIQILGSLPPYRFVQALIRVKLLNKV